MPPCFRHHNRDAVAIATLATRLTPDAPPIIAASIDVCQQCHAQLLTETGSIAKALLRLALVPPADHVPPGRSSSRATRSRCALHLERPASAIAEVTSGTADDPGAFTHTDLALCPDCIDRIRARDPQEHADSLTAIARDPDEQ